MKNNFINKIVIVRSDRAGVFFGELLDFDGTNVKMKNVRKIFRWYGAAAIEQLSIDGTNKEEDCMLTVSIDEMIIANAIQILPCTEKSINSLSNIKEWKK